MNYDAKSKVGSLPMVQTESSILQSKSSKDIRRIDLIKLDDADKSED